MIFALLLKHEYIKAYCFIDCKRFLYHNALILKIGAIMSEIVQVNFRMPAELKEKLEQSAKESGRSITSELVTRLEQSFEQQPTINENDIHRMIAISTAQEVSKIINRITANLSKTGMPADKIAEVYLNDPANKKPTS